MSLAKTQVSFFFRFSYDHALLGVLCLAVWKAAGSPKLTLGPYLPPGFLERNGIRMQNRSLNTLEKELQVLTKGPVSESKIRSVICLLPFDCVFCVPTTLLRQIVAETLCDAAGGQAGAGKALVGRLHCRALQSGGLARRV